MKRLIARAAKLFYWAALSLSIVFNLGKHLRDARVEILAGLKWLFSAKIWSNMNASRHISSGKTTINKTQGISPKSSSPFKPQKARSNDSLPTTRSAAAAKPKVHTKNGIGNVDGFQAKRSQPHPAQRPADGVEFSRSLQSESRVYT